MSSWVAAFSIQTSTFVDPPMEIVPPAELTENQESETPEVQTRLVIPWFVSEYDSHSGRNGPPCLPLDAKPTGGLIARSSDCWISKFESEISKKTLP